MVSQLLIAVGVSSAITTILAILMVIADATIANYGEVKININDGKKELVVEGGKPLLSTLMSQDIFIPSACGGRGSCGLCKVQLKSDIDFLPTELPWLSAEEKKKNIHLSCQIKVKKDLDIYIPEELFNVKRYQAEVLKLRDLTHDIKEVTLKLIEPDKIEFKAGQFIQFQVPEYELTDESVYRAYSMSSQPSNNGIVELEIRYVPNGICTTYVHKHLKEGDKITLNGPYGDFFLRDTDAEIIMIAGGSGMAPIKSILYDMAEKGINRKATYFFGARSKRDLFLLDEMKELEEKMPNFKFVPGLSQPQPEDNWEGETGWITETVDRMISDASQKEAYLCGSPGMIDACEKVLTKNGMPLDKIYYDKFG